MLLLASAALVGYDLARAGENRPAAAQADSRTSAPAAAPAAASEGGSTPRQASGADSAASAAASIPAAGPGTFAFADAQGPAVGVSGALRRYRVAVEEGSGVEAGPFGAAVESILGDPRSWIAGSDLRLQRVPGSAAAEFTVYLATPATSQRMCREEWMETAQYTSCRLSDGRVVINVARWLTGVPDYGAPLAVYQAYAINHEVGHELGHGHELCPGPGQPAPVMQQQTLGLQGCVAYAWPYLDGRRYRGPPTSAL